MRRNQPHREIPEATVSRLPIYRRVLTELGEKGGTISSEELAALSGVTAAQVRRDISYLGSLGTPGVGYEIEELSAVVSGGLGLSRDWSIVIVGIGSLGTALANYMGFAERGFPVTALVDEDPKKVGEVCAGIEIRPLSELGDLVRENKVAVGIIAVPATAAQKVADIMVENGIGSILNFAPILVSVAEGVSLRQVDLSLELEVLSFYLEQQTMK